MKKLLLISAICLVSIVKTSPLFATHAAGMDLSYQCLGNNQYLFYATFYRDCHGISAPSILPIDISSVSCGYQMTYDAVLSFSTSGTDSISHLAGLCPDVNSECVGGNFTGYE